MRGIPVFIDTEYDAWNMAPEALGKTFEIYPEVKVIVVAHLYGMPGKIDEIKKIAEIHGAVIIEAAEESLGATYKEIDSFDDYGCISFNENNVFETEVEKNDCKESTKMAARKGDMKPYFCIEVPMKSYIKVICTKHRWYGYLQAEMSNT